MDKQGQDPGKNAVGRDSFFEFDANSRKLTDSISFNRSDGLGCAAQTPNDLGQPGSGIGDPATPLEAGQHKDKTITSEEKREKTVRQPAMQQWHKSLKGTIEDDYF
ncbi:hypothetical protein Vi05172_g13590 [Venturia inaequalis]|nr:hypothetical protein Vi05172_g13590 [Venturia inaequalis]